MKTAMQLALMSSLVLGILGANQSRLNNDFKTALADKQIKLENVVDIHRMEINSVGGTGFELINNLTEKKRGISDFNKNTLPSDQVKIYTAIRIGYDASQAASGKAAQLSYATALPFSFRNAKIKIEQGGNLLFYPISELINPNTGTNRNDDYIDFQLPVVLVGSTEFKVSLEFPEGATADATNAEYLEIALQGIEVKRSLAA